MRRKKRTPNTPQVIIDEIIKKHKNGSSKRELAEEYGKPFKTIGNMITRENNKKRRKQAGLTPSRKPIMKFSIAVMALTLTISCDIAVSQRGSFPNT